MGLFDFLRDPASLWKAEPGLKLEIDLEEGSFCGVRLGSRTSSLSKLGPPSNPKPTKRGTYTWAPLGCEASAFKEMLDYCCVTINPLDWQGTKAFSGAILRAGKPLELGPASRREDVIRVLGEPWHEHVDDEDEEVNLTLFYETRMLEWEIEFLKAGPLHAITFRTPPTMEDPKWRKLLKCDKPWPPA